MCDRIFEAIELKIVIVMETVLAYCKNFEASIL